MPTLSRTVNGQPLTVNSKVKRGFTLIELLVVIAIIGILATFIVASFTSAQQKARDSKRKTDLDAIKKALELYKGDQLAGTYPLTANYPAALTASYIKLPVATEIKAGWTAYTYTSAAGATYTLSACLENANDPQKDSPTVACSTTGVIYTISNP